MSPRAPRHRLVITVCPREPGRVVLAVARGRRARRMDARAVARELATLAERRGWAQCVQVREGCAGGCAAPGPNVTVTLYPRPRAGERADHVAVGWRTYVYSLANIGRLERILEDNLF